MTGKNRIRKPYRIVVCVLLAAVLFPIPARASSDPLILSLGRDLGRTAAQTLAIPGRALLSASYGILAVYQVAVSHAGAGVSTVALAAAERAPRVATQPANVFDAIILLPRAFYRTVSGAVETVGDQLSQGWSSIAEQTRESVRGTFSRPSSTVGTSTPANIDPAVPTVVNRTEIIQPVIERIVERPVLVSGVSESDLVARLQQVENKFASQLAGVTAASNQQFTNTYHIISQSNKIDSLSSATISSSSLSDPTLTGTVTISGNLSSTGTATSTFANGITLSAGCFRLPSGECAGTGASLGATISGGTAGSVLFVDASGNLAQDNSFLYFDDTNNRLGVGTSSPYAKLAVVGEAVASYFTATTTTATSTFTQLAATQSSLGTIISGTWQGTVIDEVYGGTGQSSYAVGDILYADTTTSLARLAAGNSGMVLKIVGGVPTWGTISSGGVTGAWATTTNDLAIYPADSSDVVIIGTNATTTTGNILEVTGNARFNNNTTIVGTLGVTGLTTLGNASTTQLSVSGVSYLGTVSSGTWQGTAISQAYGGTGFTSYAAGNLIYADTSGNLAKLATSTVGKVLQLDFTTGLPSYVATSSLGIAISDTTGTLAASRGGTGLSSYAAGEILYVNTSGALARLASSTGGSLLQIAFSTGLPSYTATSSLGIAISDTTGTLGVTRGGTGLSSLTQGDLLYASAANTASSLGIGAANTVLTSSGSAPQWSTALDLAGSITAPNFVADTATATSTFSGGATFATGGGLVGIGTSTPRWNLQVAGPRPFVTLSDTSAGTDQKHWYFSSQGNNLYVGTSTDAIDATSTLLALTSGQVSISGNVLSGTDNAFSLGSIAQVWKSAFFSSTTGVYVGSTALTNDNGTLKFGSATIATSTTIQGTDDAVRTDVVLGAWRYLESHALGFHYLHNGIADRFQNETGVDTVTSTNETFDSSGKFYYNAGGADLSLVSNTVTASSTATQAYLYLEYKAVDASTLNTDVKGWVSSDGGSTWDQVTLSNVGTASSTGTSILKGSKTFTASGTSIKWKVTTHNTKQQRFYGVGVLFGENTTTVASLDVSNRLTAASLGVGSSTPWATLAVTNTGTNPSFIIEDSASPDTTPFIVDAAGNVGIGTSSPFTTLSVAGIGSFDDYVRASYFVGTSTATSTLGGSLASSVGDFTISAFGTTNDLLLNPYGGNVGVGTTSPWTRFSVTDTVSSAQLAVAYDATRYATFQVDSAGDLVVNPQGDDAFLTDDNLWVCTGGSCPANTPSGTGNLIVENRLGVGTTTPTQQLSVTGKLYVGADGASGLGTATSTFQGDIKILGKLDVSTIDPVYTIGGTKYATYGHSTVGVKEEVIENIVLTEKGADGKYSHEIAFSTLPRGSDLWLFYQVTDFGDDWQDLVVTLTPGFDGRVFYRKVPGENRLVLTSTESGEVAVRLVANRFDASRWPNLRPDQDDLFTHFTLEEK